MEATRKPTKSYSMWWNVLDDMSPLVFDLKVETFLDLTILRKSKELLL